jgi:hypothetical protein
MSYTSLSDLRKSRGNFDNLMKEVEKIANPTNERRDDDRLWSPTVDKAGNGYAVIRFLPPTKGEELPWVRVWNHGFQGPSGRWYIENSLTTLNLSDPVSELNSELWNSGIESNKEIARKQKRRLNYIANILVIKDSANPQNEGKVFLYKFGKKIFDKIKDVMQPQFEDEEPVNPFDFWKGANFKLKIRNLEGYRNYDKSEFEPVSAIADSDDDIEAIWNQQHLLQPFIDPKNFKSYDELKKKLDMVLKGSPVASLTADKISESRMEEEPEAEAPKMRSAPAPTFKSSAADEDDADDTLSYFAKLAED